MAERRRRFRLHLLIGFLVLLSVGYARQLLVSPTTGQDFRAFYAGAFVLRAGGNPYDWSRLGAAEARLYNAPDHLEPGDARYYDFEPLPEGPWLLLALEPLAGLPFPVAEAVWAAGLLALVVGSAWLLFGWLGWTGTPRWLGLLAVILSPVVFINVFLGQATPLLFAAFAGALVLAAAGRPWAAGLLLAVVWIKPNTGLVLPAVVALAYPKEWVRVLGGFAAGTLAAFAIAFMALGSGTLEWPKGILHLWQAVQGRQPDIASLASFYYPILSGWMRMAALILATVTIAVYAVFALRRSRLPAHKATTLLLAWLIALPYVHSFDAILLLPAVAILVGPAQRGLRHPWVEATIWAFVILPLLYFTGLHIGGFNGFSAIAVALLGWVWQRRVVAAPHTAMPVAA